VALLEFFTAAAGTGVIAAHIPPWIPGRALMIVLAMWTMDVVLHRWFLLFWHSQLWW
jgi:hypothetical protein